jgi:hypothetical protein
MNYERRIIHVQLRALLSPPYGAGWELVNTLVGVFVELRRVTTSQHYPLVRATVVGIAPEPYLPKAPREYFKTT